MEDNNYIVGVGFSCKAYCEDYGITEDRIAATLFGKTRITPFRVLTVMLMFASLIMTVVTAIWFLFFYLK